MKIVQGGDKPLEDREASGRVGTYKRRVLLRGEPRTPGNFSLIIYYQDGSFYSPRHHHNFDQFRYQIEGDADFGRTGKMKAGMLGYFPEGAYYGPQSGPPHIVAVLQFGGPSASGYLDPKQTKAARKALRKVGVFEGGVFRRNAGVEGRKNQDSYEVTWEQVHQRRLVYPKPQYATPIMMDSNNCPPRPLAGAPGVMQKTLGTFTDCEIRAARYYLEPGSSFTATGRGIFLVLSGSGSVEGEPLRELTTLYLDDGETATIEARDATDIVLMGLPSTALLAATAAAAEERASAGSDKPAP